MPASFPTRRSSDLLASDRLVPETLAVLTVRSLPLGPLILTVTTARLTLSLAVPDRLRTLPDRKGSRLNSRHLGSSSVVFVLKKESAAAATGKFYVRDDTFPAASFM